ncbi:MAG: hypothetical protein AMXMBFR36_04780 [Acidobacteriota bacterium]
MSQRSVFFAWILALSAAGSAVAQVPGTLDAGFATGGLRRVNIPVNGSPRSNNATGLFVQADGKIVLGGAAMPVGNVVSVPQRMVAVRLTPGGALDTSFNGDGIVAIDGYPPAEGEARFSGGRVAPAPNGGVYLFNEASEPSCCPGWSLARFNASGGLVGGFGDAGVVTGGSADYAFASDVASRPDGRVLIFWDFNDEGGTIPDQQWIVEQMTSTGDPDPGFGSSGARVIGFDLGDSWEDYSHALSLQPDGKALAVGFADLGTSSVNLDFAIARLTAGGALDSSFSGNGKLTIGFGDTEEEALAVAVDSKRRILIGGVSNGNCAIVRLRSNGTLDPTFSGDGKLTFSFASDAGAAFDQVFGLVVQGDGKVIVVGRASSTTGSGRRVGIARLNENGSFDPSFNSLAGRPGRQVFDWATGSGSASVARAVVLAADGRIVLSGGAERASGDMDFVAARLHNDYVFADGFDWGGFGSWSALED